MACLLRSPSAVQEPILCIPAFSISINSRFLHEVLRYCNLKMSRNTVQNSPWGPSPQNRELAKGKAYYGVWYQICLKTNPRISQRWVLAQLCWPCRERPLFQCCLRLPSIQSLLKSWAPTPQAAQRGDGGQVQSRISTTPQRKILLQVTAILKVFFSFFNLEKINL